MQRIQKANEIIRKVAAETDSELIDLYAIIAASGDVDSASSLMRNVANSNVQDGVHFRSAGYRAWAEKLSQSNAIKNLPDDASVTCLGDSLTWGAGVKGSGTVEGETMPAYLKRFINHSK